MQKTAPVAVTEAVRYASEVKSGVRAPLMTSTLSRIST